MTDRDIQAAVPDWVPPPTPERARIAGRYTTLEPLSMDHATDLHAAYAEDAQGKMWDYLPTGPFTTLPSYQEWVRTASVGSDPLQFAVRMQDGRLGGTLSLMRINPASGSIETGWLTFSPRLQRTRESTEAVYLLMKWAFRAGYRRFEWKCNAANHPSMRAAERFGLSYEGTFRQADVVKGLNRDTAWFAAIDSEWPALDKAFETWLDPVNFDALGRQKTRLADLTAPIISLRAPTET